MPSKPSIFVLGSFVAACSVKVDRLPAPGETLGARSFILEAGGKGFNHAVGANRLGAAVDGILATGDDLFGRLAADALAREGLPAHMLLSKDGPTGAGVGFVDRDGENCIAVFRGANALLSAADVADAADRIGAADLVTAQFEIDDAAIAAAFAIARAAGTLTMLNPSPYRPIAAEILRDTDYLIMNAGEFRAFAGAADTLTVQQALGALAIDGPIGIVVTEGKAGAWARHGTTLRHVPAFPIEAIDSIGAGDAFLVGLAVAIGRGRPWDQALRAASACGAMTTSRPGVLAALPTAREIEAFLAGSRWIQT
jgi:ribokinase